MKPMRSGIRKFKKSLILVPAVMLLAGLGFAAAQGPTWQSSDKWGVHDIGGYRLENNVWGVGPGPQTIWADSASHWGVWANHPATGMDKSYPNVARAINQPLSSLHKVTSRFDVSVPNKAAYDTAYDIWDTSSAYEVMLWMNEQGAVPAGSYRGTVSVEGSTWRLYVGQVGSHLDVSLVRTRGTTRANVDILAVLKWAQARGWFGSSLGQVQFGWEIISSPGGADFNVNRYSVTSF
jgi:Glycosyl hydrolase family 12